MPPNDWMSIFGGPAWTRVTEADGTPGQWYLHLFDPKQPDLDWTNPEVVAEFESILRFWLDRGRRRVPHRRRPRPGQGPGHAGPAGRAGPPAGPAVEGHPHWDRDEVHEVYRGWRRVTDAYAGDRVFVGEVWVQTPERLARYLRADELHTAFNFTYLLAPWDAKSLRTAIDDSIDALERRRRAGDVGAVATTTSSATSPATAAARSARAAPGPPTLLMLALPGGAYVYQGEELGLPEVTDLPAEVRQDPPFARDPACARGAGPARRVPGADPVVGRRAAVRLRARLGPALAAAAGRLGGADGREAGGRPVLDARALPGRAGSCAATARSSATAR